MTSTHTINRKPILVTGGSGFIGSNFILHILSKYPDYEIVNLDKLTYAAAQDFNEQAGQFPQYTFLQGSIENQELVNFIFAEYNIRGVIHFAAESHVDNSISNPGVFVQTNIVGTSTLLNAAVTHWMDGPGRVKLGYEECRFHHISTDEVYGALGETGKFSEESKYAPNSPYSASKASSDLLVRSFNRTYGLNVVITNCSNNYGPRQHDEKLIPTIIRSALQLKPIPIYGNGCNVRDWLHVQDHAEAIDLVYHRGTNGETYNVGSDNEWNNLNLALEICTILDELATEQLREAGLTNYSELIQFVNDRPGHDWRYAIDTTKINKELSWKAGTPFRTGLRQTIEWYREMYQPKQIVRV
ncbi:dTDP-glucose 4,6-dehydratase [Paenibacillus aceris]|uniref:dTDP-glucose 4,6-dehydratase n=1 Tax=Paenibacillus aceris TaxID=869555 RepID=A0ABS4I3W6_9BACL|nr:dTDP-glucose 4,6-dehydratase [Paenibacillus aceris]MBP1965617.1 dTDP-glucose 4,6-dehydratase [Paenibacillus aceris]NHW36338.1 dTDP-glucose 4,6-dehydratase [Paenibacillus aceris]